MIDGKQIFYTCLALPCSYLPLSLQNKLVWICSKYILRIHSQSARRRDCRSCSWDIVWTCFRWLVDIFDVKTGNHTILVVLVGHSSSGCPIESLTITESMAISFFIILYRSTWIRPSRTLTLNLNTSKYIEG